ncbi:MAG: helical backbone metal receptor [Pseudomonadota bacterium]
MPIASSRLLVAAILVFWLVPGRSEAPPHVVTLAPHLTELVYAVGAENRLVGVVDYSDYPEAAQALPRIGDAFRFDLERILTLNADTALAWRGGTPQAVADSMTSLGVSVIWIETRTLDDVASALRAIGSALSAAEAGDRAANAFEQALNNLRASHVPSGSALDVFYQVSRRPLYTLGGRHLINETLAVCGMVNVFADLDIEAAVVSREAVVEAAPDLIIAAADAHVDWTDLVLQEMLSARLVTIDPDLLTRPSPRILQGIEQLCALR